MRRGSPHVARPQRLLQAAPEGLRTLLRGAVRAFREPRLAWVVTHRLQSAGQLIEVTVLQRELPIAHRVADVRAGHAVGLQLLLDGVLLLDAQPQLDAMAVLVAEQVVDERVADLPERGERPVDVVRDEVTGGAVGRFVPPQRRTPAVDLAARSYGITRL